MDPFPLWQRLGNTEEHAWSKAAAGLDCSMVLSMLGCKPGAVGSTRTGPEEFPAGRLQAGLLCETPLCLAIHSRHLCSCTCAYILRPTAPHRGEETVPLGVEVERGAFKPKDRVKDS